MTNEAQTPKLLVHFTRQDDENWIRVPDGMWELFKKIVESGALEHYMEVEWREV